MDRLETLRLFTRIVELGSFTRAADALVLPRATATNAIKALEERLGARLLARTTRQVQPTLDGQAFYERCVQILGELDDAESSLRHLNSSPRGMLRVDLHGTHATAIVLPRIDAFHRRYPDIELRVSSGDRLVDLIREGIDCVVRAGDPHDASLVSRRLALMPQLICASPEYLRCHGVPQHPRELVDHQAVNFFSSTVTQRYPFELIVDGELCEFSPGGWLAVSDAESYVICALSGCGLIQLPRYHVAAELRAGRLVEVLSAWRSPPLSVAALYPQHRQLSRRVRVFIDWIAALYAERFGAPESFPSLTADSA